MIFKVQRPLNNTDGDWMAYSKGRRNLVLIPDALVGDDMLELIGNDLKCYVDAVLRDGVFIVNSRVADRDW